MITHLQIRKRSGVGSQRHRSTGNVVALPHSRSLLGDVVMDVMTVLRVARQIEPNPSAMIFWYQHVKIAELDSLTAEELVHDGRAGEVVRFLRSVQSGVRH
jgi:hypothetical protein